MERVKVNGGSDKPELGSMEVRTMALSDLDPAPYNPRKISKRAFRGLGSSIDTLGMLEPIIWNERSGQIVGGHQRYRALLDMGETETDVVVVDLDGHDEVALNIALNSKTVRGNFTGEVKSLLAKSEVQLGSRFQEMGLGELKKRMDKINWGDDDGPSRKRGGGGGEPEDPNDPDDGRQVVVTCPECGSRWDEKDGKVIYDALAELEDM